MEKSNGLDDRGLSPVQLSPKKEEAEEKINQKCDQTATETL